MKKIFIMCAMAASALIAQAQDLIIETVHSNSDNVKILQDGRFTPNNNCIGFTSDNTRIDLGEVDFGDGSVYNAVGINFANGYSGWGSFGILSAGTTFDDAVPFAQIGLDHTQQYENFKVFAANMGYLYTDQSQLPGGEKKISQNFVRPTGVKRVFLWFVGGAGNIRDVLFYKRQFSRSEISDNGVRLLDPTERNNYPHTVLPVGSSNLVSSPSPDTRIDNDSWGWTQSDVIVDYGEVDFDNGKYGQILAYYKHWQFREDDHIEFYIDDANNPANYLGSLFTGFDFGGLMPGATNIPTVTGVHHLLVRWVGGSSNIGDIHLVEGRQWIPAKPCDLVKENEQPTQDAKHYTFLNDVPAGATKLQFDIVNKGRKDEARIEGAGNVGYTSDGVVLKLKNIDFDQGQYNRIIVNHSSDKDWIDYIEHSSFAFFIDNFDPAHYDQYLNNLVSVVRIQGTGDWGNRKATAGDLATVTGVHDVYIYYNLSVSGLDAGTNVFDIYLDAAVSGSDFTWNNLAGHSRFVEGELANSYKNTVNVSLNKFVKIANQQRTMYRTNQATGAKTPICTLSFNNTGKEFSINYASPMAVDNPMRFDTEFVTEAGQTRNPIIINDYFTASTAQGGDKAGAYVYSIENTEATASVPVYAATVDARLAMADGSAGYTLDEVKADTDHNLKAQSGYSVAFNNVSEIQDMTIDAVYCNHDKVSAAFTLNGDNFFNKELGLSVPMSAALKVGDNTYGTNQASVEAALLQVEVSDKGKSEYTFNNGSRYFSFLVSAALNAINIDNFDNTGGGFRVWRNVEDADEAYADLMVRNNDFLFFDNVGLDESSMLIQDIGGETIQKDGSTYTSGTFGSSSEYPVVTMRIRAYYKNAASANLVKAKAPANDVYNIAETIFEVSFIENVVTGLKEVTGIRAVKSINYYNAAGQMSNEPFKGINVVVTTYDDGTTSSRKIVR